MEVFFVDDPSGKSQEKARSFLARNAIRRRVEKRAKARNAVENSTWAVTLDTDKQRKDTKPEDKTEDKDQVDQEPVLELEPRSPLHTSAFNSRILNKRLAANIKGVWGVSSATCPNPAQAGRSAFRASNVAPFIQLTIHMFNQANFSTFDNAEEQKKSRILALTYRGEAMKMARNQLFAAATTISEQNAGSVQARRDLSTESHFITILQLVLMDYVFFPTQARAHFAASRDLIRSWTSNVLGIVDPTKRVPSFIHNDQVNHIVTSFECVHLGPESLIWDRSDIYALQKGLCRFMSRISEASSPSGKPATGNKTLAYKPRIHSDSLVWRSLTKTPGPIPYDIQNCLSESNGQMAAIMVLCSIFMDYKRSPRVAEQCVYDLESALISLGDEALASALNLPWMMAGGIGMPVENRRERIYWILGMQHVFRWQQNPIDNDSDLMNRIDNQCEYSEDQVRQACLEFLAAIPVD